MTKSLNDLAETATTSLTAINFAHTEWRDNARSGGYASHFKDCPQIDDHLHIELLEAITDFDCDPVESLRHMRPENEPPETDALRFPLPSDEEFDYNTSRGLSA